MTNNIAMGIQVRNPMAMLLVILPCIEAQRGGCILGKSVFPLARETAPQTTRRFSSRQRRKGNEQRNAKARAEERERHE
jgi:hypothetical protein